MLNYQEMKLRDLCPRQCYDIIQILNAPFQCRQLKALKFAFLFSIYMTRKFVHVQTTIAEITN